MDRPYNANNTETPAMLISTLSLAAAPARPPAALAEAVRALPGLRQAQLLRVLRHIPTDSVRDPAATQAVPGADRIQAVVELYFEGEVPAAQVQALDWGAPALFSFDSRPNIPVPPRGAAAQGGFRRWMLLVRKAATQEQFRDAWFGRHAELLKALPHIDGYLQNLVGARYDAQGRAVDYAALPIDGIAEICFADEAAMTASYTSEARLPLRDDGRALLERITTVLVQGEALA
jgi:hypothetical protein